MAYLAYNGKPLMRMSKWIDYNGRRPEPLGPGLLRLQFDDTSVDPSTIWTSGAWTQVYDQFGDPIPGLFDCGLGQYVSAFTDVFRTIQRNPRPASLVGVRGSSDLAGYAFYHAFTGAYWLHSARFSASLSDDLNESSLETFLESSGVQDIDISLSGVSSAHLFSGCAQLSTAKIDVRSVDYAIDDNCFTSCTALSTLTVTTDSPYIFSTNHELVACQNLCKLTFNVMSNSTRLSPDYEGIFEGLSLLEDVELLGSWVSGMPISDDMGSMFKNCYNLKHIPALSNPYHLSNVFCASTFENTREAQSGAVDAYNVLSAATPRSYHYCFTNCGDPEVYLIPSDWR